LSTAHDEPRRNPKKRSRLVSEHRRRKGDPALGGSTRAPIMTAYRQQALPARRRCREGRGVCAISSPRFPTRRRYCANVYGWFDRAERGIYMLPMPGIAR